MSDCSTSRRRSFSSDLSWWLRSVASPSSSATLTFFAAIKGMSSR